jgi:GTP-binding protein
MPQTKFVLKKALELGLRAVVIVNKIDKPGVQIDETVNKTFDLFVRLGASDYQLDFPIIYCSGIRGLADKDPQTLLTKIADAATPPDITPLMDAIVEYIPAPDVESEKPFAMLALALAYDNYKGKLATGKVAAGKVVKGQSVALIGADGKPQVGKVTALQMYDGMRRVDVEAAEAGDIVALAGFDNVGIGDTITDASSPTPLPRVDIEPPTIKMTFGVNTSPFAGREGKLVTSRQIRDRLNKELETNVALKVDPSDEGAESFLVSGRGELHLAVLVETMRREGFELQVSQPQVIFREVDGEKQEPYESVSIDVPSEYQGAVIEEMGKRGGTMSQMDTTPGGEIHLEYTIPTRGLIGLKGLLLTRTRGTIIMNNLFDSYRKVTENTTTAGTPHGSLIATEAGVSNSYGLNNAQERGTLFIGPAVEVYEGMVVGQNALDSDIEVNVNKTKKLTNMRASGSDAAIILTPPKEMDLDLALEYIGPDELVEVTPVSIRIRKKYLNANDRKKNK